jgi:hypothetical protein
LGFAQFSDPLGSGLGSNLVKSPSQAQPTSTYIPRSNKKEYRVQENSELRKDHAFAKLLKKILLVQLEQDEAFALRLSEACKYLQVICLFIFLMLVDRDAVWGHKDIELFFAKIRSEYTCSYR